VWINTIALVSNQLVYIAMSMLVQTYILCGVNVLHAPSVGALHPVVPQELCSIGLVSLAPPQPACPNLIRQEESNKDQIALIPDRWDRFSTYGAKVYGLINRIVNLADEDSGSERVRALLGYSRVESEMGTRTSCLP
jgi:hypothetical protein